MCQKVSQTENPDLISEAKRSARQEPSIPKVRALDGIAGWLWLTAFALIAGPSLHLGIALFGDLPFIEPRNTVRGLLNGYSWYWTSAVGIATYDFLARIALTAGLVYLNILFWKKKRYFPRLFIFFLVVQFGSLLFEYGLARNAPPMSVLNLAYPVWIGYFLMSQRVKATFIR